MPIRNLATHQAPYVTVGELAEYWAVSRQQIYKRIESGHLTAIRLGARLYRVPTLAALEFERRKRVSVSVGRDAKTGGQVVAKAEPSGNMPRVPEKVGFQE